MTDVWSALHVEPGRRAVVAEISNAHNGDEQQAHDLVAAVIDAGASAVKFQCYTPDELVALRGDGPAPAPWGNDGWTMRRLYEQAQTPFAWFPKLIDRCALAGVPWFASVFGPGSLAVMELLGCPVYKISALEYRRTGWREVLRATGKPLVMSSPLDRPLSRMLPNEIALYCPPGYPQEVVSWRPLRYFDGFSYHGTSPVTPAMALALGARLVEVHVQLDDVPSALEANVSLTMEHFGWLVQTARDMEPLGRDQREIAL